MTVNRIQAIVDGSTFVFQGSVFRTLPHFSHMNKVNTVNMVNGVHRTFDANEVRNLIASHNTTNNNEEDL